MRYVFAVLLFLPAVAEAQHSARVTMTAQVTVVASVAPPTMPQVTQAEVAAAAKLPHATLNGTTNGRTGGQTISAGATLEPPQTVGGAPTLVVTTIVP